MILTKKNKIIVVSTVTLFVLVICMAFVPVYLNIQPKVEQEMTHGTKLSGSRTGPVNGGWVGYKNRKSKIETVVTTNDIFRPVYSIISQDNDNTLNTNVIVINFDRVNLLDFEVRDFYSVSITNKSFSEAVEIARKYDLSKENPDPENIRVFTPPTAQEVEEAKQREAEREAFENSDENKQLQQLEQTIISRINRLSEEQKQEYYAGVQESLENSTIIYNSQDPALKLKEYEYILSYLDQNYPETK